MPSRILAALRRPKRIATSLPELRYLVFEGMKGDTGDSAYEEAVQLGFEGTEAEWLASLKGEQGEPGKVKSAYLDYDVVRLVEDDSIYTSATMWSDIDNGVLPLIHSLHEDEYLYEFFELDQQVIDAQTPVIKFRSRDHLLNVDSTGHFTLTGRPQGGGTAADAVLYTQQTLTPAQQEQACENIGAVSASTLLSMLIPILRDGLYGSDQTAAITALEIALGGTPEPEDPIETYTPTMSEGYINPANGNPGGTSTYKHTEIIPVREGDKVYGTSWDSNYSMTIPRIRARFTAAYDSNGDIYPAGGVSDQHDYEISTPFVVPSGVYGVVFSIVNSLANQVVVYVDKSERVGS